MEGMVSSGRRMSLPNTFTSCEQVRGAAPSIPLSSDEDSWNPASSPRIFRLSVFQMLETAVVTYKQQVQRTQCTQGVTVPPSALRYVFLEEWILPESRGSISIWPLDCLMSSKRKDFTRLSGTYSVLMSALVSLR